MSDDPGQIERDPETLAMFVEESLEALTRVEGLLLAAERGAPAPGMMAVLFRDMHTVKGTSAFLALDRIMALSHAAEDLMSSLRDGELELAPAHCAMLLLVVDALRGMITSARDHGHEGAADHHELTARLRAALDALASGPAVATADEAAERPDDRLGAILVAEGVIAPEKLDEAVEAQHKGRLGQILVSKGLVTEEQVREALSEQKPHTLGALLVASGAASPDQISGALKKQSELRCGEAGARGNEADGTVRVSVQVLDRLMNLMGELVLARNQMVQIAKTSRDGNVNALAAAQRLGLVTSDLQEQIMKTRMQPIARVFEKIPRMVRDLAQTTHKAVDCHIEGNTTELDRALIEAIRDPIMHIVRNSVDHGIEDPATRQAAGKPVTGRMVVRASHEAGMVCIEVEDDGRGMDPEKLRAHAVRRGLLSAADAARLSEREALELVFRAGFSTAEKVTNISGRGVGMDVVRSHVERAGGQVELQSTIGRGTSIRLKMPLTLAIIPALLVKANGQRFCIPQVNLLELVYLNEEQTHEELERVRNAEIYRLRGAMLPIVRLNDVLGTAAAPADGTSLGTNIVVVAVGKQRYGLIVDEILDTEEIVVKPLHPKLKRLACYAGATVLGDGGVALILEVAGVASVAGINVATRGRGDESGVGEAKASSRTQTMLVLNAGADAQCAVPLAIVSRLEQIAASTIEVLAGREVVQYRDQIMPIVRPERAAPLGEPGTVAEDRQIVVFDFGQPVGMQVNAIVDVVETAIDDDRRTDDTPGALGSAVIFGKTTLLLDVYDIVRRLAPAHVREPRARVEARRPRVLFVDDASAIRTVITTYLRSSGIEVVEFDRGETALAAMRAARTDEFDALITDLEMPGIGGMGVIRAAHSERPQLPVLVWTHHDKSEIWDEARRAGARAVINKMHREQLMSALASVGALASGPTALAKEGPR